MDDQLQFVVIYGKSGKVRDSTDRLTIRSRCMQGVNKRKDSRRSLADTAKSSGSQPKIQSHAYAQDAFAYVGIQSPPDESSSNNCRSLTKSPSQSSTPNLDGELIRFIIHEDTALYPRELASISNIFHTIKGTTSPVYQRLYFDDELAESPLPWILRDELFRHAVQFQVSAHKDCMRGLPFSMSTLKYYRSTVVLLRSRLSGKTGPLIPDTTIWCILILGTTAVWMGSHAEVNTHISALKHIIELCGATFFLAHQPTLRFRLNCLELANSTGSGTDSTTKLGGQTSTQSPEFLFPSFTPSFTGPLEGPIDTRVVSVFHDLQEITASLNRHEPQKKSLHSSVFELKFESMSKRLHKLRDSCPEDSLSEALRLAMLAFLNITMMIPPPYPTGQKNKARLYPYLTKYLRKACRGIWIYPPRLNLIIFWILTVSAMSIFDVEDEGWLRTKWNNIANTLPGVRLTWKDARAQLEHVVWMSSCHDTLGKKAYNELIHRD